MSINGNELTNAFEKYFSVVGLAINHQSHNDYVFYIRMIYDHHKMLSIFKSVAHQDRHSVITGVINGIVDNFKHKYQMLDCKIDCHSPSQQPSMEIHNLNKPISYMDTGPNEYAINVTMRGLDISEYYETSVKNGLNEKTTDNFEQFEHILTNDRSQNRFSFLDFGE